MVKQERRRSNCRKCTKGSERVSEKRGRGGQRQMEYIRLVRKCDVNVTIYQTTVEQGGKATCSRHLITNNADC